ncbi:hypothetical protein ACO0K2_18965 [Undibacterium sp. MH2W]|uniref:hypothetical protein n=1 Tax=Undibacterium sp. MH2W TaxID=3413044 RepID=UPI003BF19013
MKSDNAFLQVDKLTALEKNYGMLRIGMLTLIYYVELFWLFIDTVSGFFQNNGILFAGQTIAALFRIFVFGLLVTIVVRYFNIIKKTPLFFLAFVALLIPIHAVLYEMDLPEILTNFQFQLKMLMSIFLYYVLYIQMKTRAISALQLKNIIVFNSVVLVVNVYLGIFGIGFGSYGEDALGEQLGSKGFFYAGNEVSITLVAIYGLLCYQYRETLKKYLWKFIFLILVFFVASISLLSKTAMLGFVLITLFSIHRFLSLRNKLKVMTFSTLSLLATVSLWMPILEVAIDRWLFHLDIHSDLIYFITSGRSERIGDLGNLIFNAPSVLSLVFGYGWIAEKGRFSFENDFFDAIGVFGPLGLAFSLTWIGWMISGFKVYIQKRSINGIFTGYAMLIIILISFIAGHVLMSVMAAPFVALVALVVSKYYPSELS